MNDTWKKFKLKGGFSNPANLSLFLDGVSESGYATGPLGLIIAIIFFFILYAAYRSTGGPAMGLRPRAVWMWDDIDKTTLGPSMFEAMNVVANPIEYLAWARAHCVVETWIDVTSLHGDALSLKKFLALAKSQGMATQFLADTGKGPIDQPVESGGPALTKLLTLIESIDDKSLWPLGVQTNLEGLSSNVNEGTTQKQKEEKSIMDNKIKGYYAAHKLYLNLVSAFNVKHGVDLRLVASVGNWWINFNPIDPPTAPVVVGMYDTKGGKLSYGEALLSLGCDVSVQDYSPPNWDWSPAVAWCDMAAKYGRRAFIGMSVGPPKDGAYVYYNKMSQLEPDLDARSDSCIDKTSFSGMAIHTAAWYGSATSNS